MISILLESLNIFLEEIFGLPLVRAIEFTSDVIPGSELVFKLPYQMGITILKIKKQVDELLKLDFERPSVSPLRALVLLIEERIGGL